MVDPFVNKLEVSVTFTVEEGLREAGGGVRLGNEGGISTSVKTVREELTNGLKVPETKREGSLTPVNT